MYKALLISCKLGATTSYSKARLGAKSEAETSSYLGHLTLLRDKTLICYIFL